MIEEIEEIPTTWSVLYVGLNEGWLQLADVVILINSSMSEIGCDEDMLVDINVNEDDMVFVINILKEKGIGKELEGFRAWRYIHLSKIARSGKSILGKLEEIGLKWAMFGYPEEWKGFIHYMPNEKTNSSAGVYELFLIYLEKEKRLLNGGKA